MKIFKLAHNGERFTGAVEADSLPEDVQCRQYKGGTGTTAEYLVPTDEKFCIGISRCYIMRGYWSDNKKAAFFTVANAADETADISRAGYNCNYRFEPLNTADKWRRHTGPDFEEIVPKSEWTREKRWQFKQECDMAWEWFNDPDHNKE